MARSHFSEISIPQRVTLEGGEVVTFERMESVHLEGRVFRSSISNWACHHILPRVGSGMADLERYGNALFLGNSVAEIATVQETGERTVDG